MRRTFAVLAISASLLAACGKKTEATSADAVQGPVVATSEAPRNAAVDTTPTTGDAPLTPGANSFTEAQARGAMEKAGYSAVGPLSQTPAGIWQAKASKGGTETTVSVDYKGAVTAQ